MLVSPALLVIIFILIVIYLYKFMTDKPSNFPPGPLRLPILGSYFQLLLEDYKFPFKAIHNMAKRYKTNVLSLYLGDFITVVACDEPSVKELLLHPDLQGRMISFIPILRGGSTVGKQLGIFFTDGDHWKEQRRFMLRNMRDFGFGRRSTDLEGLLQEEVQDIMEMIRSGDNEICKGGAALVMDIFYTINLNLLLAVYSGQRQSREKLLSQIEQFLRFSEVTESTSGIINLIPWIRHLFPSLSGFTAFNETIHNMRSSAMELIDNHKSHLVEGIQTGLIDRYLQQLELTDKEYFSSFSKEQLTLITMDLMFATMITSSGTLGFSIEYMLLYPVIQGKVQQEIDSVVGQDRSVILNDRPNMPYTEATMREVMRHQTLLPLSLPHRATRDTYLCGYFIPKDAMVLPSLYSSHMDENAWEEPQKFNPERFIDSHGKLTKRDISVPFGAGKRLCAGETFARQNMFVIFASLLQNFTLSQPPGKPLPDPSKNRVPGTNITPESFWVQFTPRS